MLSLGLGDFWGKSQGKGLAASGSLLVVVGVVLSCRRAALSLPSVSTMPLPDCNPQNYGRERQGSESLSTQSWAVQVSKFTIPSGATRGLPIGPASDKFRICIPLHFSPVQVVQAST